MKYNKDEYILRAFSKIQHKKWELYVITRIIHLLNDSQLEFVCQQLIRTPHNKRYLADLCFPGLELYLEVDELQHSKIEHSISDKNRMNEIIDATNFKEIRIKIYDKEFKVKKLSEINKEVDSAVNFIIDRKKEYILKDNFIPWDYYNKYNPEIHIERGYLDATNNVSFLYHRDAMRCFGYKGGHYQRAVWPLKKGINGTNKQIWFPKLYKNNQWNNSISDDFKTIEMRTQNKSKISEQIRNNITGDKIVEFLVFAHYKDFLGQIVYKFLGEFHSSRDRSTEHCHVYIRKNTRVNLS